MEDDTTQLTAITMQKLTGLMSGSKEYTHLKVNTHFEQQLTSPSAVRVVSYNPDSTKFLVGHCT